MASTASRNPARRAADVRARLFRPQAEDHEPTGAGEQCGVAPVGVATVIKHHSTRPLVFNSIGDGATQEGEFLEACAEAVRLAVARPVPDPGQPLGHFHATRGQTFYSRPDGEADSFYGMPIYRVDGRHVVTAWQQMKEVVSEIRRETRPGRSSCLTSIA